MFPPLATLSVSHRTHLPTPALVGRHAELRTLLLHFEAAAAGGGHVVLVCGDAGVGKTRLVEELVRPLRGSGQADVVVGRCHHEEPPVPYGPFLDVARALAREEGAAALRERAGPGGGALAALLPELEEAGPAGHPVADAATQRRRMFEALARALRPGDGRVRVVVLEDVQWCDPSSRELLGFLARALEGERVLVAATCREEQRPGPLAHLFAQLRREGRHHVVRLAPLTRAETGRLLHLALGEPAPARFADAVYAHTEGNPFFVEEGLRALEEAGRLDERVAAAREGGRLDALGVPASLRASLLARAAELDETAAEVLRYAAVIGRRFEFELLPRLTGLPETAVLRALEALVEHGWVDETEEGGDRYAFRHALSREAVYGALLGRDRRRRHREVLAALEEAHAGRPEAVVDELARHAAQAGEGTRAAVYARAAGERAARMHAFREAVAHFEAALDGTPEDAPRERARLHARIAEVAYPSGDAALCARHYREAQRLYEAAGEPVQVGDIHRRLGEAAWQRGDARAAFASVRAAVEILEAQPHGRELAMACGEMAAFHLLSRRAPEAMDWARRALELAERLGDGEVMSYAANWAGCARVELGDVEGGLALLGESLALAKTAGSAAHAIRAYTNLGANLRVLGRVRCAAEVLREGDRFADAAGWESGRGRLTGNLGAAEMELGHWDRAEALLDRALGAAEAGHSAAAHSAGPWRAELLVRQGRAADAAALLESLPAVSDGQCDAHVYQALYPALARARLALGDAPGAAEAMDRCRTSACGDAAADPGALAEAVRVYLRAGRCACARDALAALETAVREAPSPLGAALLEDGRGLAARCHDPREAAERFGAAADAWARMGLPFQEARARRRLAAVLLAPGAEPDARDRAARELRAAREAFARLGAAGELATADVLAARHGLAEADADDAPPPAAHHVDVQAPPAARPQADLLSGRELEVLRLIAAGRSNRQIARETFVAECTVKTHVIHIFRKLGVRRRTEAVARARELSLLPR